MQELVYQHGIHSCFNSNIEVLRDAVEVIGLYEMSNAYQSIVWGITDGGRLTIMINNRRPTTVFAAVVVEFQGDGCLTICKCDSYGEPINEKEYTLFDTHSYMSGDKTAHEAFKHILRTKYDIVY